MAYNMKRGAAPKFKELGSSPVKQKPGGIAGEAVDHWQKYKAKKDLVSKKPSGNITQALKTSKLNIISAGKQAATKLGKFLGGKTLGVAGMMMGTTSKADQPKSKKSEGEQIKDLLTKHKLKGGKN
jgi:hypothetical protein